MVQAVAEQIGESPERIKERKVGWAAEVVKRGVIIDLHIGRTRFIRKITKEDLGLDEISDAEFQQFVNEYYDLGSKLLIPKRILLLFNRIEGRARNNLYRFTFQTPWGCFCPYTTYSKSQNLMGAIFTTLRDVLESIKAISSLSGPSVKSLKGLIEKTRMMNFMGDEDVEEALLKIEEALSQKFRHSSLKNVAKVFHNIATEFRVYALEKDELPDIREFGLLL